MNNVLVVKVAAVSSCLLTSTLLIEFTTALKVTCVPSGYDTGKVVNWKGSAVLVEINFDDKRSSTIVSA